MKKNDILKNYFIEIFKMDKILFAVCQQLINDGKYDTTDTQSVLKAFACEKGLDKIAKEKNMKLIVHSIETNNNVLFNLALGNNVHLRMTDDQKSNILKALGISGNVKFTETYLNTNVCDGCNIKYKTKLLWWACASSHPNLVKYVLYQTSFLNYIGYQNALDSILISKNQECKDLVSNKFKIDKLTK